MIKKILKNDIILLSIQVKKETGVGTSAELVRVYPMIK